MRSARPENTTSSSLLAAAVTALAMVLFVSACSAGSDTAVAGAEVEDVATATPVEPDQTQADDDASQTDDAAQVDGTQAIADPAPDVAPSTAMPEQQAVPLNLSDEECEELGTAYQTLLFLGSTFRNDAQNFDSYGLDVAEMQANIDLWRPYQDVAGRFGEPRADLDNLTKDLVAASEGRLDDISSEGPPISVTGLYETMCA